MKSVAIREPFSEKQELWSDVAYRRWIEERRLQLATEIVAAREACRRGAVGFCG
ncbi:MAG TPA: hypothetical protein PLJ24_12015 [Anaerolineae bacterium]|nr:hypothetical protein [Anaerolineae bacterium]